MLGPYVQTALWQALTAAWAIYFLTMLSPLVLGTIEQLLGMHRSRR
ncbi:hypothetical protein SAMN05444166_4228 [Singulisphaera sp. GP187]|nr:hypothetical protein SAMN05444166_4228 [Singulisphaera sp. GP187]